MKWLWIILLTATAALADLRMEVARGPSQMYPVAVRVTGGQTNTQYWVQRSDDAGKTWDDYIRVQTDEWWYVSVRPQASMFRARTE